MTHTTPICDCQRSCVRKSTARSNEELRVWRFRVRPEPSLRPAQLMPGEAEWKPCAVRPRKRARVGPNPSGHGCPVIYITDNTRVVVFQFIRFSGVFLLSGESPTQIPFRTRRAECLRKLRLEQDARQYQFLNKVMIQTRGLIAESGTSYTGDCREI